MVICLFLSKKQIDLNPATSLTYYCIPSPPTSELTGICVHHVCQQFFCTYCTSRIFSNRSSAPCTTKKLWFCNNFLLAKFHPHPPLPASLFQHRCLFSSLLKYFPSLVSVTAFFSGSRLLFQVSIRQLPSCFQISVSLSEVLLPYFYTFYQHLKIHTS